MKTEECNQTEHAISFEDEIAKAIVTVLSVDGDNACVESSGSGACSSCESSGGCGTKSLLAFFGTKAVPLNINNHLNARVGDQVEIGIEQSKVLKLSVLSYLLPLVGLFGGGALSAIMETGDVIALGMGLAGLFVGFTYSRYLYSSENWGAEIQPVCIRIVSSGNEQYVELESVGQG
jgi:sigma-E factor negative regulatory protein RseC